MAINSGSYRTTCHRYKINFQFGTKVSCVGNDLVSCALPQYTPMSVIRAPSFDTDYFVGKFTIMVLVQHICFHMCLHNFLLPDVIGLLTGVGTEREINRTGSSTKLNVISIEADG